jgi:hypothetical protein
MSEQRITYGDGDEIQEKHPFRKGKQVDCHVRRK